MSNPMVQSGNTLVNTNEVAMTEKKYPSQDSSHRINIYLRPEDQDMFDQLAKIMHAEGETGVIDGEGNPVKSVIVRKLMQEKLGKSPVKKKRRSPKK